jgi:hypothetical protein
MWLVALVRSSHVANQNIGAVRNPPLRCWNMEKLYSVIYNVRFGLYPQFEHKSHLWNVPFTKQCLENQSLRSSSICRFCLFLLIQHDTVLKCLLELISDECFRSSFWYVSQ